MYFRNVTRMQLERIAAKVGVRLIDAYAPPNAVGVCLRLTDEVVKRPNTNEEVAARLAGVITTNELRKLRTHKKYQRVSVGYFEAQKLVPRRIASVCWHGHRDFLAELFKQHPNAQVFTSGPGWITADGSPLVGCHSFSEHVERTGYVNVGTSMLPIEARAACVCENGYLPVCKLVG